MEEFWVRKTGGYPCYFELRPLLPLLFVTPFQRPDSPKKAGTAGFFVSLDVTPPLLIEVGPVF